MAATTTKRGPYKVGIARRLEIVTVATRVFGQHGYRAGSLAQIAEAAGTSPSAIVRLFGSKEQLLTEVFQYWDDIQVDARDLRGLAYFESMRERIDYSAEHRGYSELMISLAAEASYPDHPVHAYMKQHYATMTATMAKQLLAAVSDGELPHMDQARAELEVRLINAVMDGLQVQWLIDPSIDIRRAFAAYLDAAIVRWRHPVLVLDPARQLAGDVHAEPR